MENLLSLLESVETSWLTPSSTTWATDMILAFVCGLGLFCLILPLLPLDSPSPTPAENTTPQKVLRKEHRKVRKKIRTVKAYRGSRKKPKEDKVLGSHLHSMQERLVNSISICQHLGQKASGEAFKPDAAKALLPPRHPTGKSVATMSSLETSSAPCNQHLLLKDSKPLSPVLLNSSPIESQTSEWTSWPPETLTTGRRHSPPQQWAPSYPSQPLDPMAYPPPMPDLGMAVTSQSSQTLPGLPSPMPGTPGINISRRPTLTTLGLNYSSRSTLTSLGLNHLSRPTSTTTGLNHLSRATSTTAGLNHLSRPTSTSPGLDFLSRPTSTTPGLNNLSRPTSTTSGLDHLRRPTSTTSGLKHSRRPTSTTSGLEHSSRPTSGPFRYQVTSRTLCSSTSSPDESLQEDLSLTIHKASFWTGPTDSQIEPGEPSFISPVIQEMLEVQIRKRVQLKLCKEKGKGRSDLSYGCMGSMLHVCSSKEANITSRLFSSKDNNSEQLSDHQKVLTNDLKDKYIQLYWGLPWLHSESLVAPVLMAGSPLDPPSILFNGLSTYSPLDVNTKGLPQLYSPQPLFQHSVKSDSLIPKVSWSRTPSETRIQAKAHDPSSLSKLSCNSAPIRKDGASCPTPTRTEVIVSPSVRQLERHLVKKHRESRSNLPVMVKKSQEAFNPQTSNSWGSQGQGPVVHLQGDYIIPKQTEEFKTKLTQHQGPWPPKVQLFLGLGLAEVNSKRKQTSNSEVPGGISYDTCVDHAFVPSEIPKPNLESWNKPSFNESVTNKNNTNGPSLLDLGTQKLLEAHITRHLVRHRWRLPLRGLKAIHILKMKKDTTLPFPQSSNDSLSWDSTDNSMIQLASNLREPIQQAPERDVKTKTFSVESQFTQNCPALQPALMREALPRNDSGPSEAPTTTLGYSENLLSTPESLVGRAWHKDTLVRSWEEFPEPNPGRIQESEGGILRYYDNEVSVREISGSSQSSRNRGTRELEETEEKESCEWTIPVEAANMADFQINQFLEARGNLSKTLPQNADNSGLRRPHCSAAAVILQDCATGELCQDWDPEVVIAAEILASMAVQCNLKTEPATIKPTFHYRSPFLGRDSNVLKNHKLEEPQHTDKYGTNTQNEKYRSPPRQNIQLKGTKPFNVTFGDKMKRVLLNPTHKVTNNSIEYCKGVPSMTPSQGGKKNLSTVCHASLKIQSQPSPDGGMPYGNRQARTSRNPVYLDSSYQDRAHVAHVPGIPVYCPRHGHCIKV